MRTRYCIRDVQRVDFREWFSFKSGSHYNRNCVIKPQLALGLLHNLGPIMLWRGRNVLTLGRGTPCSLAIILPCGVGGITSWSLLAFGGGNFA